MIKIDFFLDPVKKTYELSFKRAFISIIIYFIIMIFGGSLIVFYVQENPYFITDISETDVLIETLHTKNGVGIISKDDFENSTFKNPNLDVYDFLLKGFNIEDEHFLDDYLLISSFGTFSPSVKETLDEDFVYNIFKDKEYYVNGFKVYRFIPSSLKNDEALFSELFSYFNLDEPVFDYVTLKTKDLTSEGSSLINLVLYLVLFVGLVLILFNYIVTDINRSSFLKVVGASFTGLLILYVANIFGNMISIILSSLLKERVIDSLNQMAVSEAVKSSSSYMMILAVIFLGPIVEELIYRKSMFALFKNKTVAIAVSSILFGLIHLVSETSLNSVLINLPGYLIPGLVFGYIYTKNEENVLVPTFTHILSNLISVILISFL